MLLLADECCHGSVVEGLRRAGHDVRYVAEEAAGLEDAGVLALALAEGRYLLTEDKDFGEMVVRLGKPAPGVILVRMEDATSAEKIIRLTSVLRLASDRLAGNLVVVGVDRVRFHRLRTRDGEP